MQSLDTLSPSTSTATAYPERGFKAYSVVLGAWLILFPASGLLNSTGIFQAWLSEHQLQDHSESDIAWIFSTFAFLFFFGGIGVGALPLPYPNSNYNAPYSSNYTQVPYSTPTEKKS